MTGQYYQIFTSDIFFLTLEISAIQGMFCPLSLRRDTMKESRVNRRRLSLGLESLADEGIGNDS